MGKMVYKKPEPAHIQGICVVCNKNKQKKKSNGKYQALCSVCDSKRFNIKTTGIKAYQLHKKDICEKCGFIPEHVCQLDVDHIDGNHKNDDPSNLQTLCANCHRLKSYKESFSLWRNKP